MFCKKCGCEHSDNAAFCAQCGESLTSEKLSNELPKATIPMTKTDYFANHCSGSVQKKRKAIKGLSITCLVIQGVLNILVIISLSVLAYALQQTPLAKDAGLSGFGLVITFSLMFTASSFVFTIMGMKKNSTGFLLGQQFLLLSLQHLAARSSKVLFCANLLSSARWLFTCQSLF